MTSTSSLQLISSGGTLTRALSRPRGCRYSPVTRLSRAGLRAIEPGPGGKRMSETTTTTPAPTRASGGRTGDFRPIAAYGLLADCNSAALVDRYGSVDWLCVPRYDSDAVFARILDPDAGHWSIRPVGSFSTQRRYLPGPLVLETTFTTAEGSIRLIDAMSFAEGQRGHELGLDAPHELVRLVEGVSGQVQLAMELAPRPEYGLVRPLFRRTDDGGRTFGGPNQIAVTASIPVAVEDSTMTASFTVSEGEQYGFALRWASPESASPLACSASDVTNRIDDTVEGWRSWEGEHDVYEGPHRD